MRRGALAALLAILAGADGVRSEETRIPPPAPLGSIVLQGGPPDVRPRFVLVLSGGGARGSAHIGVLKVLEELHVVPDMVVGTSMGSIVGGLYAAGWTPEEIEKQLKTMDWGQVFTDRVPRNDRSFRRKQDDIPYLVATKLRFRGIRPYVPPGLLGGQRLELMLRSLEFESTGETDFDRLPIPYRAVGADIVSGEAVVIGSGSLSKAMRASMSISGVFAPVDLDGHRLVDGGAVANLPVGIAQKLGAERIVAVDISSPLSEAEEIGSFFSIISQMSGLLTVGNVQADIQRLKPGDVYLKPELGDISFTDFKRAEDAVRIGEEAARAKIDELRPFAASDADWEAFLARRSRKTPSRLTVDEVRIDNQSWVADELIERRLEIETGKPLGQSGFTDALMKLQALDYFGRIEPEFVQEGDKGVLHLSVPRKPYGRTLMQFGISLYSDWSSSRRSDSGFQFVARHQVLAVNRRGGEWENTLRLGTDGEFVSHFYQPLDYGMRWFVDPAIQSWNPNPQIWVDGVPVAKYSVSVQGGRVDMGRVFEHWGELRVGPYWYQTEGSVSIGDPVLPSFYQRDAGVATRFRVDTRDTTAFPRHGTVATASYTRSSSAMGADGRVRQAYLSADQSLTHGKDTFTIGLEALDNVEPVTLYHRLYTLGGAARLSGLGNGELLGQRGGLARVVYYRELTKVDLGPIAVRLYAGGTLEAGQAYLEDDPVTWASLRRGGSVFIGADTPLGPSFFGWGYTDGGRQRLYVSIGQRF